MKIIDFHTHIYPDKVALKATRSIIDFYGLEPDDTGVIAVPEMLVREGGEAGIDEFVALVLANRPDQVRGINEFAVRLNASWPQIHCFGTVHAGYNRLIEEADLISSNGLLGIKLHPDSQQFNTDDPRLFELYDYCQGRIPFLIHCGDYRYDYSHPRRLRHVLDLFPKLEVIGAHLGGWSVFDDAVENLAGTECFVDISSTMEFLPAEEVVRLIRCYGADRCLFGTDFPVWDPHVVVALFERLPLTDTEREQIAHLNAERLIARWEAR